MNYFLTDWEIEFTKLESNTIFNIHKILDDGKLQTKIINTKSYPFSNYFLNRFNFYKSDKFVNIFDIIFDTNQLNYSPLSMKDLKFLDKLEKTYTRNKVILSKNGVIKGEVLFNEFGFVSQIEYYQNGRREVHNYSEKGNILSKKIIDNVVHQTVQEIFDDQGKLILREYGDYLRIGRQYRKYFKQEIYDTFNEVCIELINMFFLNFNPEEDRLIIDGKSLWLMRLIEHFRFPQSIIYVFSGTISDTIPQIENYINIIGKGKQIVTDNFLLKQKIISNYPLIERKTKYLPIFSTNFDLGKSNEGLEKYIYWQIKVFDSRIIGLLGRILKMKLTIRELCLIIESEDKDDEIKIDTYSKNFITENFDISFNSSEYDLVKKYYEALKNKKMTAALRDLFQKNYRENTEFSRVVEAYLFYTGITFRKSSSVETLKTDFKMVRLFIDQRKSGDFLSHSLAVSAGIPIFSKIPSPYLINGKNGILYKEDEELLEAVSHYLSDADAWNQSLVESVEIIQNNCSEGLIEKWIEVLK